MLTEAGLAAQAPVILPEAEKAADDRALAKVRRLAVRGGAPVEARKETARTVTFKTIGETLDG
jgi:hypothetical protein